MKTPVADTPVAGAFGDVAGAALVPYHVLLVLPLGGLLARLLRGERVVAAVGLR